MDLTPTSRPDPALGHPDKTPGLVAVARAHLDRARSRALDLPPPRPLSAVERRNGDLAIRRQRRLLGLADDAPPPVLPMLSMLTMLSRNLPQDAKPPKTVARMIRMAKALRQEGWPECGMPELMSGTKYSFYGNRRYTVRAAEEVLRDAVAKLDGLDGEDLLTKEAQHQLERANGAIEALDRYPPDPRFEKVGIDPDRPKKHRQRQLERTSMWHDIARVMARHPEVGKVQRTTDQTVTLNELNRQGDWRRKLWTTVKDGPYAAQIAVCMCYGPRRLELARHDSDPKGGILVELLGDGSVSLTGDRVKVSRGDPDDLMANKGQEWSNVVLAPDTAESRYLARLARQAGGNVVISFQAPACSSREAVAHRWTKVVQQIGKEAFPRMKLPLCPYTLRDAFAAEVKRQVNEREEMDPDVRAQMIAEALGHISTVSAARYGSSKQASRRSRGPTIISTSAPSPVRRLKGANPRRAVRSGPSMRR